MAALIFDGLVDELGKFGRTLDAGIKTKLESGRMPQTEPATHFPAQKTRCATETFLDRRRITPQTKRDIQNPRHTHVRRDLNGSQGNRTDAGIAYLAADQLGQSPLDLRLNASLSSLSCHYSMARATSTRA
jgi:hypothetical protein